MKEAIIIKHCLEGSRKHQRILFDTYYKIAYNKAFRYLTNSQDAEDAVITAFNQVFKHLHSFEYRNEGSLRNWIITIVVNASIKLLKAKNKFESLEKLDEVNIEYSDEKSEISDQEITSIAKINMIIQDMPIGYKSIFLMHTIEGYRHNEIAQHLGISIITSKSQLSKANSFIRNKMNSI